LKDCQSQLFKDAESCFQSARQIARQQGAKTLELRAASSLCRLWQRQGRSKEGSLLLSEIVDQFSEGWDTLDLRQARALLDLIKV
jgi:predicted ATPase